MQIFSSTVRNLWNTWELPAMVVLSLVLQVALIPMGHKRKYTSNIWLRWLLWLAYLSANWIATVSLGVLSNNDDGSDCKVADSSKLSRYVIRSLWAPFLLLHLGGPNTITAYSMQDNDLWLRHLLGLLLQAGFAFYVFLRALQPTALNFVAIPVFVSGIIKYGERIWVLRYASSQYLRDLLLSTRELTPTSKRLPFRQFTQFRITYFEQGIVGRQFFDDRYMLDLAHCFFESNKPLFVDLVLSSHDLPDRYFLFKSANNIDSKTAFKIIELELGFMYDFFYTKASVIHSHWGNILRLLSLSSIVVAITTFCRSKIIHSYPLIDVCLTFFLLFGALALEIYSILLLFYSDWCVFWMAKSQNFLAHQAFRIISHCGWSINKPRWSNSVPQYNLITQCMEDKNASRYRKLFFRSPNIITQTMETSRPISDEIKEQIFKQLKDMLKDKEDIRKLPAGWALRRFDCVDLLGWSLELDLDESILLWHIATDLCYHSDHEADEAETSKKSSVLEDSKSLSNFLTYLLVYRHSLFPNGVGQIRFRATIEDANQFVLSRESMKTVADACKSMLDLDKRILRKDNKDEEKSLVFYNGVRLAKELQELYTCENRWEIISNVWVEMLANISCQCKWYEHVEQLGYGGDLLTHVWLFDSSSWQYINSVY